MGVVGLRGANGSGTLSVRCFAGASSAHILINALNAGGALPVFKWEYDSFMELSQSTAFVESLNPLDMLEELLAEQALQYTRLGDDELNVVIEGQWCSYHLSFSWHDALEAMHVACTFDTKTKRELRSEVVALLALINEQLWVGHFDMWSEDGMLIFRHGVLLQGEAELTPEQAQALIELPVDACERYFPAFQFVLWGGKSAAEAMTAAMFETAGQA